MAIEVKPRRGQASTHLEEQFVNALAAQDAEALRAVLRPDISFRALTPDRFWEADDVERVVDDILLRQWFGPSNEVELIALETENILGQRDRVGYRLRLSNPDGNYALVQQAFYMADDGRIGWLRLVCTGFLEERAS
jgi:hypothetical protein